MPSSITQISLAGGVLSPATYARVDLQKFGTAGKRMDNMFVHAEGGISNRAGTSFVHEVKDQTKESRLIPFQFNEEQAYGLEFGENYIRIIRNGGLVLEASKTITGVNQSNPTLVVSAGHGFLNGDEVFISGVAGMTPLNDRYFTISGVTATTFLLDGEDSSAYVPYAGGGTVARVYEVSTTYLESQLDELKFRQSNDVLFLVHQTHPPRKLSRSAHDSWTLTDIQFKPSIDAPTGTAVVATAGGGGKVNGYVVTAYNSNTGEESIASTRVEVANDFAVALDRNTFTWNAVTGATSYNIYKDEDHSLFLGFIGSSETQQFVDRNIAPDLSDVPVKTVRNPFDAPGNYPGAVGLHEQRIVYGNTNASPLTTEMSQTSQFDNFNISSPTRASDAVAFRLVTGQGNEIRHYRSFSEQLFIFTSGAVWNVKPGGDADGITPSSKKVSVETYLSSTDVPPLTIKENILMVSGKQNKGFQVSSLGYQLDADGYIGSDLTVLARHLFEGHTLDEWAYSEHPYKLILAKRDDGKMLCMTYLQEHQIFAWTLWETDGEFESLCNIPEGQEDVFYFIVKRTIDGVEKRYVERMHTRTFGAISDAYFVDCGLTYSGTATTTVSGLEHLEGKPVIVLADGNIVEGLTVSNGLITLPNEALEVHVGLSYRGLFESLPINRSAGSITDKKIVKEVTLRVNRTRGISAGTDENNLENYPSRSLEVWGGPAALKDDLITLPIPDDWGSDVSVITASHPGLPLTILSVTTNIDVGK